MTLSWGTQKLLSFYLLPLLYYTQKFYNFYYATFFHIFKTFQNLGCITSAKPHLKTIIGVVVDFRLSNKLDLNMALHVFEGNAWEQSLKKEYKRREIQIHKFAVFVSLSRRQIPSVTFEILFLSRMINCFFMISIVDIYRRFFEEIKSLDEGNWKVIEKV